MTGPAALCRVTWVCALLSYVALPAAKASPVLDGRAAAPTAPPPGPAAEARPRVSLRLSPCLDVDRPSVEYLLAIELGTQLADAPDDDTSDLSVTCVPAGAELRVDDPLTGKSLLRVIDLSVARPAARSRLLALALAELVFTSWTELAISLQPVPPPEPQPQLVRPDGRPLAPDEARSAATLVLQKRLPAVVRSVESPGVSAAAAPSRHAAAAPLGGGLRLLALGSAQAFSGSGLLLGGGLRIAGDYGHHLGFSIDALENHGSSAFALGEVAVDTLSAAAALTVHGRLGFVDLRAGAGGRLGAARLSGTPQDAGSIVAASLWGPFAGPLALVDAGVSMPAHLVAELSLEGGYVLLPVTGRVDGQRALGVAGGFFGVQLGLGWQPRGRGR